MGRQALLRLVGIRVAPGYGHCEDLNQELPDFSMVMVTLASDVHQRGSFNLHQRQQNLSH